MNPVPSKPHVIPTEIDLKNTAPTVCDQCGGEAFQEAMMLRKVSALLSGTGKEGYLPVQIMACVKCGNINQQFLPQELRTPKLTV